VKRKEPNIKRAEWKPSPVYRMVNAGTLPGYKVGKDWRFN